MVDGGIPRGGGRAGPSSGNVRAVIHAASTEERERLLADFIRYCEIESPSGRERGWPTRSPRSCAGWDSRSRRTTRANLLARIHGPERAPTVLLCAHMDTVPLDGPVEVVSENGLLTNRHEAILGADNKAAIATIMGAPRRSSGGQAGRRLELLFTTGEELALKGAKAFDRSRLRSDFGYVFDHATPIGEIVLASPTYYSLEARFKGQAAHAGIRPEAGHNAIAAAARAIAAMRIGRIDSDTTANVGRIEGGTAANVVAERCYVELETRSLDDVRAGQAVSEMVDALAGAASDSECDVETSVERLFQGYRLPRTAPAVEVAAGGSAGMRRSSRSTSRPAAAATPTCSSRRATVVNLANGTDRNHQPDESVTVEALETMLDVTIASSHRPAARRRRRPPMA